MAIAPLRSLENNTAMWIRVLLSKNLSFCPDLCGPLLFFYRAPLKYSDEREKGKILLSRVHRCSSIMKPLRSLAQHRIYDRFWSESPRFLLNSLSRLFCDEHTWIITESPQITQTPEYKGEITQKGIFPFNKKIDILSNRAARLSHIQQGLYKMKAKKNTRNLPHIFS